MIKPNVTGNPRSGVRGLNARSRHHGHVGDDGDRRRMMNASVSMISGTDDPHEGGGRPRDDVARDPPHGPTRCWPCI